MGTRLQWLNLDGGYKTYYFSYDQYSRHLKSGFGLEYFRRDESNGFLIGDYIEATYSPHIAVGKRGEDSLRQFVIKPAFNFGYFTYKMDWSKLVQGDMYDPYYGAIYGTTETKNTTQITAPDFGAGVMMHGKTFFTGFYYHHFTEPDLAFITSSSPLFARMVFHGGYILKGNEWLKCFILSL